MSQTLEKRITNIFLKELTKKEVDSLETKKILHSITTSLTNNPPEMGSGEDFLLLLEAVDYYLGEEVAFQLLEVCLLQRHYFTLSLNAYLSQVSRFKYDANIARKIAAYVQHKASNSELQDVEWWMYCHAAYLNKEYDALSNVAAELRRRPKKYYQILNQYLMFDTHQLRVDPETSLYNNLMRSKWVPPGSEEKASTVPIIGCDAKYFESFIAPKLAALTNHRVRLHLAIADPSISIEVQLDHYKRLFPGLSYSTHFYAAPEFNDEYEMSAERRTERRYTFYASLRFLVASRLLEQQSATVYTLDADSSINLDELPLLCHIIDKNIDRDIALKQWHFDYAPGVSHEADFVVFRPTRVGIQFAKRLQSYLLTFLNSVHCYWTLDQVALNACKISSEQQNSNFAIYNMYQLSDLIEPLHRNLGGLSVRGRKNSELRNELLEK